ncbi:helix-turn-helix transcriptional regulator [Vibrio parahaemolyticus]|uniref:helix-turn-helix domain-containing protein n=1 Tax=Vibrio alginolyticus TaxID=663 RepID=UPI0035C6EC17|nr:helix-turn-helix transcriptional regulator [Vibrio parahaemolyticus]
MLIRERFKRLRERKGISQLKLAQMADITNSHISRFENGKHDITLENLSKLLRCMGSSPAELFADDGFNIPVYEPDNRAKAIDHIPMKGDFAHCYAIKIKENGIFPAGSIAIVSPMSKSTPKAGDIVAFVGDDGVMSFEKYRSALHDQYAGVVLTTRWTYDR